MSCLLEKCGNPINHSLIRITFSDNFKFYTFLIYFTIIYICIIHSLPSIVLC